jgi:hypothetical protein
MMMDEADNRVTVLYAKEAIIMATISTTVYVLVEEHYEDNVLVTDVVGAYTSEEDAERNRRLLQRKLDISEPYHGARIVIRDFDKEVEVPKYTRLAVSLDLNNRLGKPHICGHSNVEIPLHFEPLKDNVYSCFDKGSYVLTIGVADKSVDEIIDEAYRFVKAHKDVCPQWVFDSNDGHDASHPQGEF